MGNVEVKDGIAYIESVADLSPQELKELQTKENITQVAISGKYNNNSHEVPYSVKEYKKIYSKLQEYTEGIDPEWSKTKKFVYIFRRISKDIDYDYIAGYPKKGSKLQEKYSEKNRDSCRNLKNGLLSGKCVCAGYAEILRHVCALEDIDCRFVQGYTTTEKRELHAWNIVEIEDGKWIEVDPTWSHQNGVEYIGDDKERFWKEHEISDYIDNDMRYIHSRYFDFPLISNFDLNKFINSELGITQEKKYLKEEQAKLIELLESRDVRKIDITQGVTEVFEERKKFEQEIGYTLEQLEDIGISTKLIGSLMNTSIDVKTGKKIDKKATIDMEIEQKIKIDKEFEEETGYTIEELRNRGLSSRRINNIIHKKEVGKIDRKTLVELQLQYIKLIPEERKIIREASNGMIHPQGVDRLLNSIYNDDISVDEAILIIEANKNNLDNPEVKKIKDKLDLKEKTRLKKMAENYDKEFEEEVGYTIEQIKKLGFSDEEIEKMKDKFNDDTGERIDRKKVLEDKIKNREKTPENENVLKKLYKKFLIRKKDLRESANVLNETQKELISNDIEHNADMEEMR